MTGWTLTRYRYQMTGPWGPGRLRDRRRNLSHPPYCGNPARVLQRHDVPSQGPSGTTGWRHGGEPHLPRDITDIELDSAGNAVITASPRAATPSGRGTGFGGHDVFGASVLPTVDGLVRGRGSSNDEEAHDSYIDQAGRVHLVGTLGQIAQTTDSTFCYCAQFGSLNLTSDHKVGFHASYEPGVGWVEANLVGTSMDASMSNDSSTRVHPNGVTSGLGSDNLVIVGSHTYLTAFGNYEVGGGANENGFMAFLGEAEDPDDDEDGIADGLDDCRRGDIGVAERLHRLRLGRLPGQREDTDDDNDGVTDESDDCQTGNLDCISGPGTDHDLDGCWDDTSEDEDDDNDGLADGWTTARRATSDGPPTRPPTTTRRLPGPGGHRRQRRRDRRVGRLPDREPRMDLGSGD